MSSIEPFTFGLVGLGGYAGGVLTQLADVAATGLIRVVAATDPTPEKFPAKLDQLKSLGATFVPTYDELLALRPNAVWLPLPIDLHLPFTQKALAAGVPVLCEKPAAGCIQDVHAMMKLRDASRLPVAIGFQDLFDPAVRAVKAKLLGGAIGSISHASLIASWPRTHDYFGRSTWAGALKRGDTWVLDSPANNAISHFLNLALFLLGPTEATSADITRVEAELYRANDIQNYDTCALRLTTAAGATLLVYFTHASDEFLHPTITLSGTGGMFKFINDTSITLTPSHGPSESFPVNRPLSRHVIEQFVAYVRGQGANIATLENAAVHAKVISAVSQAAAVHTISPSHTRTVQLTGTSQQMTAVPGLLPALNKALSHRMLLHEAANAGHLSLPWTHAAGWLDTTQYTHFAGPKVV